MNKKYKKFILLGIPVLLILALFFFYLGYSGSKRISEPPITKLDETITIFLEENGEKILLEKDKKISFISKSLQPLFVIRENKKISNLEIYFDDSEEDLLTSKFSDAIIKTYNQGFEVSFPHTLEPKVHKIIIKYIKEDKEINEEYSFLLILFDDFSTILSESLLWGLTASASQHNNWEIKNGRLLAKPLPTETKEGSRSSLFSIKRLQEDFLVQFDLIPKSDNISFLIYLFERKLNFVFGNGGNKDVVLLKKGIRGDFSFEVSKTYHIRLIRNKNIYKFFITKRDTFLDEDLLFIYEDKEQLKLPFDSFGFTIWKGSGGVEIDNFYTANEDVSVILNSYAK